MLVQALTSYADTYLGEELGDAAFEEKPVPYAIEIYEDGTFARIQERFKETIRGKGTVREALTMKVPKSPIDRAAGTYPLVGCDAIQYVLGPKEGLWTKTNEMEKHQRHFNGFVELIRRVAEELGDPALKACAIFYGLPLEVERARSQLAEMKPRAGSSVVLSVISRDPSAEIAGGALVERLGVRDWWNKHYAGSFADRMAKGGEGACLNCGGTGPIAPTHDKIKGVASLGGQPSGVSLMSFDKAAFRSYGWEKNANSPMDPRCAVSYVAALNDLLKVGTHRRGASRDRVVRTRLDAGGCAFLFWTREPSDDDVASLFENADPNEVAALLNAPHTGKPEPQGLVDPNDFYLAAVSGNGGRLLVRYWFKDKLANVRECIRRWFQDLSISDVFNEGERSSPPRVWELLSSISGRGKTENVGSERAVQLMRRALHGVPLGRTILAAALGRLRAVQGNARLNSTRLGLVRICVNDIECVEQKGGAPMSEFLDEDLSHAAYLCGRLLAIYDRLQYAAQGGLNVTVADRYYAMASTLPQLAFPKLEQLSRAHFRKLRRDNPGAAVNIERELSDQMTRLGAKFPASLSLEDQGRFAIGFHHQKAEDQKRIAESRARKMEVRKDS